MSFPLAMMMSRRLALLFPAYQGRVWQAPVAVTSKHEFDTLFGPSLAAFPNHEVLLDDTERFAVVFRSEDDRFAFLKARIAVTRRHG